MDRKTMYIALAALVVVIAAVLIYTNAYNGGSKYLVSYIGKPVPQSLVSSLNVSESISNKIGIGAATMPSLLSAPPLTSNGKPQVLYIGAEYCPYCAVTRWGMIIALSRFGTFSGLEYMISNTSDIYPGTPTFTFVNATYTSNYITFTSVETMTQNKKTLQTPTPSQGAIFSALNPGGGIPFIDFANYSLQNGAPVTPQILDGYNWTQITSNLAVTNSSISQGIVGSADVFTAQICKITNFTPTNVCSQPYIAKILK